MIIEEMWDRLIKPDFPCIRPDFVEEWFRDHSDDDSLAEALAQVCNRVGFLASESSESDDIWLDYVFYDWLELEEKRVQTSLSRLRVRGVLPERQGYHFQMLPFMEEHVYRDGNGWWIKTN